MATMYESDLWKYELIIGKYPAKTTQFHNSAYKTEIMEFYKRIRRVVYFCSKEERRLIQQRLYSRVDMVMQIFDSINREYDSMKKKRKLDIILCKANKLQFTISTSSKYRYICVNIPIFDLNEDW